MKQLAQYQDGRLEVQEVPEPMAPPGGVLVRTLCSVISPGTEKMKVEQARMSLLQKAKARPDQVKKVLDTARTLGWKSALEKVRNRLESPTPLGYSAAGVVVAVDEHNTRFQVGDRVACGGAECAYHAEFIAVPDLLAARVPEGVEDWQAAYTTLASISMEAVRQSEARLGERVLVVGQGLVGLLATGLLRSAGVRVMATDFSVQRLDTARKMGAECVVHPGQSSVEAEVHEWTEGHGVDAVLLCVGGRGREAADTAISCLRDRGVMVIVGIYDAELSWKTAYMKDIRVKYSRSYGPGRYDAAYEWGGQDYPIGHVRWTENRNFESCLHLMKTGALDLGAVTTRRASFAEVVTVYDELMRSGNADIGVVLEYGDRASAGGVPEMQESYRTAELQSPDENAATRAADRLHVIGAGNFARTMLLPHAKGRIAFGTVVNGTGLSARHVKEKFGFAEAATDAEQVFQARDSGAVMISTRHHLHARMVLSALSGDRHVFVEKPLCLTRHELHEIDVATSTSRGSIMVGFNRRFAPATVATMSLLKSISGPKTLSFHVNAGVLAPDHWYSNVAESGGRVVGEACHFFDFACHLLGRPVSVLAQTVGRPQVPDSISAQVAFEDGSSAQIVYTAEGDAGFPKESFRLSGSGLVVECENFQTLTVWRNRKRRVSRHHGKGHAEEVASWVAFLRGEALHPLAYAESRRSMLLTFAALDSIRESRLVRVEA